MVANDICAIAVKEIVLPVKERQVNFDEVSGLMLDGNWNDLAGNFSYEEFQYQPEDVLGRYSPMSSPGTITLYIKQIRGLFWYAIRELHGKGYAFWNRDLEPLAKLVVNKTYWHEHFHLFTDVHQFLTPGFKKQKELEEALAVAFSRIRIESERERSVSSIAKIAGTHYLGFMDIIFNYQSPGYRDWRLYSSRQTFLEGLLRYINPPNADKLIGNGIPVHILLEAQLDKVFEFRKNEVLA